MGESIHSNMNQLTLAQWATPVPRVKFRKASEAAKARWENPAYREKVSIGQLGRDYNHLHTPEVRAKQLQTYIANNHHHTKETRERISEFMKQREYSDSHIIKQMESHGREIWYGAIRYATIEPKTVVPENPACLLAYLFKWDFNLKKRYENRVKASKRRGEHNPHWKGGITPLNHAIRDCTRMLEWRDKVFARDGYKCRITGEGGDLQAHHIVQLKDLLKRYKITSLEEAEACEELWDINNGVTMQVDNHRLHHKLFGKGNGR
jgi:5-methylcytosine-specific restriction endonuclease McrA